MHWCNVKITQDAIYGKQQSYTNSLLPINISQECEKDSNMS